jgi:hypothetical protein
MSFVPSFEVVIAVLASIAFDVGGDELGGDVPAYDNNVIPPE